jgi:hypothetical protein
MIEGSGAGSAPLNNDLVPDPGGLKKYGSGSATLQVSFTLMCPDTRILKKLILFYVGTF